MLKGIAMALSDCIAKQENTASYNTYNIVPDFFGDDWKEIKTQMKKRNIHTCKMNRGNKSVSWNDKLDLEVFDIWYLRNRADTLKSDSN